MKNLAQIDKILNLVQKPARYIANELNSYPADMSAAYSVVLCFPDIYEVGASNLGLEILYHLINEKKLARCERVFAPGDDLENILRENNISLFSLESHSDLKSFDILGFTIQCELVATNIINILDLAGISVFSRDRKDGEPFIIGGGPALTNPEPFCDFFDLFVLGDGEEAIEEIIIECRESKIAKLPRIEVLKKLSKIEGVYIPSFYDVRYNRDNTIKCVIPIVEDVKPTVKKRSLNLEDAYFPEKKIIPFVETVHNRLNIEIARGCPGRCRFCQASKYYRPWRQRPFEKLLEFVKKGIKSTGFEEISFSSLSCSDYKYLDKLLIETNNLYGKINLSISLPSLRCNEHSLKLLQYINKSKRPTLTFAPEAGSDRLRSVIGKYLSEEQIVKTLLTANAMGWKTIKLYFMIGLPTETCKDILCIERLIKLIKKKASGLTFTVTISPFVPKAQTAFQWVPMANVDEIKQKINILSKLLPANVKAHNHKASVLEALIAKGDRRLSSVIYKAWLKGAKFDQWADKLNSDIWEEAIAQDNVDLDFYLYRNRTYDEILPWEHLDFGVTKKELYTDYVKGLNESANSEFVNLSTSKSEIQYNSSQFGVKTLLPKNYIEPKISVLPSVMRLRIRFSKNSTVRFVSHLEQVEVFRRVLRRSNLPVAFTVGFNPKIKSSYSWPLSVGYESSSEYMELYLTQNISVKDVKIKISNVLPQGFQLLSVEKVPLVFPAIDTLSNVAEYEIKNIDVSQAEIDKFLQMGEILVKKTKKGKTTDIDAKPLIRSLKNDNGVLRLQLRFNSGKSVKPEAILQKLLEDLKSYEKAYSIKRTELYVETKSGQIHYL